MKDLIQELKKRLKGVEITKESEDIDSVTYSLKKGDIKDQLTVGKDDLKKYTKDLLMELVRNLKEKFK